MIAVPRLFGIVLAAGASARMGREKALLPWPPYPSLLAAHLAALAPITEAVVVVAGANAAVLAPFVGNGASLVVNPAPERGQFSSLRIGLEAMRARGGEAAVITPVDCPPLRPATLTDLHGRFLGAVARGLWGLAPERAGRHGHPLLAGPELITAFLEAPESDSARAVRQAHSVRIEFALVDEAWLGVDLNTVEEYANLLAHAG